MKYLLILLFSFPAYGQTVVKISKEDQKKYGLKKTVNDKYLIYTHEETKKIRKTEDSLASCKKARADLASKILKRDAQLKAARATIDKEKENISILKKRGERLTKKYHKCLDDKAAVNTDWKPWLITAASLAVAIAGFSTGAYYMYKYEK